MTTITVRNIPEDVRNRIAAKAAAAGLSMQEFLRRDWIERASRPSMDEFIAQARSRLSGTRLSAEEILASLDEDRER